NSSAIVNIINRVTGGNVSNIDGLIKSQGSANLFLINPAGIVFRENAKLDIGGSFIGSTAESILFEDGFNYSAIVSEQTPLLTVSVPLGLQMGSNSGDIEVSNSGHNLSAPFRQPLNRGSNPNSLSVNAGNTIALIGGNISFTGGILNVTDGRVELGAVVSPDIVSLNPSELGWTVNYEDVSQFGDIQLGQQTLVEASNIGAIQLYGQNILFQDGSLLLIENQSNQPATGIDVRATGTVEFVGATPDNFLRSGMISDSLNSGRGGDISISANKITARDNGGLLRGFTFADGDSSNISLSAKDMLWKGGEQRYAIVEIRTLGTGNGGVLELNAEGLIMQDSSLVSNVNNGSGSAGSIIVNATESVKLGPNINNSTLIGSSSVSANGNAGSIAINTKAMTLSGGARISSSTFGS
ncbi:MAG: filamentous hemagglutinin N-terminal domain-containing protein, partial [Cyanobacteria bacterium J06649_11]